MRTIVTRNDSWRRLLLTAILASGCGEHAEPPLSEADAPAAEPSRADHVVTLSPELLARTEIDEAEVRSVPGDQSFVALGHVTVDEHRYAEVGSPVTARVIELLAHVGDHVVPGDPLARLASVDVGRARADLAQAEAASRLAETRLTRVRELHGAAIEGAGALEQAEAEAAEARTRLDYARAQIHAAGATGRGGEPGTFLLRSPIVGTVLDHQTFVGRTATANDVLFRLADLTQIWAVAQVYEDDALRITSGAPVRVTFPARPGDAYAQTVTLVESEIDLVTRAVHVRVEMENPGGLVPGMAASLLFSAGDLTREALLVPAASVQRTNDGWCVFVRVDETHFDRRVIVRGRDLGGEVEVLSGLSAGDRVVRRGSFVLRAASEASDWSEPGG
jgi:cobalt-zinc-cadmium efflux system membrane fusion protein